MVDSKLFLFLQMDSASGIACSAPHFQQNMNQFIDPLPGDPRLKNRLHVEIETAKTAVEEFIALLMASPSHDESIVKALQNSPQVEINHIQTICEVSGLALRVTLSEEAC